MNTSWHSRITLAVIVALLASIAGFVGGRLSAPRAGSLATITGGKNPAVFDTQTATITGKVTKVNGDQAVIQNLKGASSSFKVDPRIYIVRYLKGGVATKSAGLKDLDSSANVIANLSYRNSEYVITSLNYLPTQPQLIQVTPPVTSPASPAASSK